MSRTDKDRPYWVRASDPTTARDAWHRHWDFYGHPLDCDIDQPHVSGERYWARNCVWVLHYQNRYRTTNVPRWFVDHVWTAPERVRERNTLREAVKAYNAEGDVGDFDFPNYQHRHNASWYWD